MRAPQRANVLERMAGAAIVAASSFFCVGALADTKPETSDATTPEEERLYDQGASAARAGRWGEARDRFREAFSIHSRPRIAALLGRAELEMGEYRSAAEHLARYLREEKGIATEDEKRAKELFERALSKVATVSLQIEPAGTRVRLDGIEVGAAPLGGPIYVEPGTRGFEAIGASGARSRVSIEAAAGKSYELGLSLLGEAKEGPRGVKTDSSFRWGVASLGFVLSLAGVGAGVGLALVAADRSSKRADSFIYGSIASFSAGAAFAMGTTVFAMVPAPGSKAEGKVGGGVYILPGGGGVGVSGAF